MKSRGATATEAFYSYSIAERLSYAQRLATVRQVDPEYGINEDEVRQTPDDVIVDSIRNAITAGRNKKMEIVNVVTKATKASKAKVYAVLEAHSGPTSLWDYERKARGAHVYFLHPHQEVQEAHSAAIKGDGLVPLPPTDGTSEDDFDLI